jgi:uncharacterized membrane protein YuzA (DUF378 family)
MNKSEATAMNSDQTQIALLIIGIIAVLALGMLKQRIERKAKHKQIAPPILSNNVDEWV